MDLFAQILDGVTDRVNADAWLSAGVPAELVKEDPLEEDTADDATAEEHRRELNEKLNERGVIGLSSVPDLDAIEGNAMTFRGVIAWIVNKKANKAGAQKPGHLCALYTASCLHRYRLSILNDSNAACQSPEIFVTRSELIGEEDGKTVWAVEYETKVLV